MFLTRHAWKRHQNMPVSVEAKLNDQVVDRKLKIHLPYENLPVRVIWIPDQGDIRHGGHANSWFMT